MPASTVKHVPITLQNPRSPISEAYRTLRTNIEYASVDAPVRTVLVTSAQPNEGKTTTVANLAVVYAMEGKNVLIVDADLRKPTQHLVFMKSNRIGLTSYLAQRCTLQEAVAETDIDRLHIMTSGPLPPNPAELLASKRMEPLLQELCERYDIVLIDSPPVLAVTDALILAAKCDGVIAVLHAGKVKREHARNMMKALEHVRARCLGVVLNNKQIRAANAPYYSYYTYGDEDKA